MSISSYRGFSGDYRLKVGRWQEQQFRSGALARPTECKACGQKGGEIIAHLEDYDRPAEFDPLCVRCHLVLHCRFRHPGAWERYKAALRAGATFPPLTARAGLGAIQVFLRALETKQRSLLSDEDAAGFHYGPKRGPGYLDTIHD